MTAGKTWAKVDGKFWVMQRKPLIISSEFVAALQASCEVAKIHLEEYEVEVFHAAHAVLAEFVASRCAPVPAPKLEHRGAEFTGVFFLEQVKPWDDEHYARDVDYKKAQAWIDKAIPESWKGTLHQCAAVSRSAAVAKGASNGLPASLAMELILTAKDLSGVCAAMAPLSKLAASVKRKSKSLKLSELEQAALGLCAAGAKYFATSGLTQAMPADAEVHWSSASERFTAQSAFACYLSASASHRSSDGFWGSTNKGGCDLGAAKLFGSKDHAMQYFTRGGFRDFALVEVEVAIKAIAHQEPGFVGSDAIREQIARRESQELTDMVERSGLEAVKRRIAELEASMSAAPLEAKPARSRL